MRKLFVILVILVVLAGGFAYYLLVNAPNLAKQAIEEYAPLYVGAPVTIDEIAWSDGYRGVVVRDFVLGNPPGFEGPHAVRVDRMRVDLDMTRTWLDTVWIKRIEIDGAHVDVRVQKIIDTNLEAISDHAERSLADPDEALEEAEPEAGQDIRVVIDRFDFTNASVSLASPLLKLDAIEVPDVHLRDIDHGDVGSTVADVAEQLLRQILDAVLRRYIDSSPLELLDKLKDKLKELEGKLNVDALKDKLEEKLNIDELKEKLEEKLNVDELKEKLEEKLNVDDLKEKLNVDDLGDKLEDKLNVDDLGKKLEEKLNLDAVNEKLSDVLNLGAGSGQAEEQQTAEQEQSPGEKATDESEAAGGEEPEKDPGEELEKELKEARDKLKDLFKRP